MFDLGWGEIAVIALVAIIVLGPKELPNALRMMGRAMRKVREVSREFQGHVDDMVREAELDDVRKQLDDVRTKGIANTIQDHVDPKRELDMKFDPTTGKEIKPAEPAATSPAQPAALDSKPVVPMAAASTEPAPQPVTEPAIAPGAETKPSDKAPGA
ncbi:Sec-independent protein translocase protein TatB [Oceanibaculum pacificum]|uniref:Sec-independent protein translocase protein TatB n=1 Tax=Oceanibaculum pacificum TaxID=580166 RepID=A0A154VBS3_9PROT|nr:Sec-independent protein translocase protein TatB [Oceanibaculum pacificum]KZC98841.1 hypothetical protein AUP43_14615 [Oceanibaculum pacificum]